MARDCGEFMPKRQILIYPATYNDYTENSPFPSVKENGTDYLLTAGKMQDYIDLYASNKEDKKNPYFAPYITQVSGLLYWLEHCSPLLKWQSFSQMLCGLKKQISQSP